jgi:hypothetical protein
MVVFLAVHVVSTVVDGFAPISWLDAIVPFGSAYRPIWLGLGALALDLLIALVVTSLVRSRLPHRVWRAVHWTAYACWPVALVHGLGTGSDGGTLWVLVVDAACVAAVVGAVTWRIVGATAASPARRAGAGAVTALALGLIASWTMAGPASAGWARRAGTPDDLLADAPATAADPSTPAAPAAVTPPFVASLDATASQQPDAAGTTLRIDGALTGAVTGHLHVELSGPAAAGGGLQLRSGQLSFGSASQPDEWAGTVTGLRGNTITAKARAADGRSTVLTITVQIDERSGHTTGTVEASTPTAGG